MFNLPPLPRTTAACEADLQNQDAKIRLQVVRDLGRVVEPEQRAARIALLIQALKDKNAGVRKQSLLSLADWEAEEAISVILPLLADVEVSVRQMAVLALGEVASPGNTEVLGRLASLLSAGDASLRYQALLAYCQLEPENAETELKRALSDNDLEVRELAVRLCDEVLIENGLPLSDELSKALVSACSDSEIRVRIVAQLFCAENGLKAARDVLLKVVNRQVKVREPRDEQESVRVVGRLALDEARAGLRQRAFGFLGFSLDPFRWVALSSLARMGDQEAKGKLLKSVSSRRWADRVMAVQALGGTAQTDVIPTLRALEGKERLVDQEILAQALASLEA